MQSSRDGVRLLQSALAGRSRDRVIEDQADDGGDGHAGLADGVEQVGQDGADAFLPNGRPNSDPNPLVRRKTAEEIIEKVGPARRALNHAPTG